MKDFSVSIVLPVYNEEERIAACLEAIGAQTVTPTEVIVVDNNSTDGTRAVAETFPFVKVITSKRQGVVHARRRGFDAAQGDIIGRIDADTIIPPDWVASVQRIFKDRNIDAISGSISYYDVPFKRLFSAVDYFFRSRAARLMGRQVFLQGANMALRKSAWNICKDQLCDKAGLHEDFDIAIHLSEQGAHVAFCPELKAEISARCLDDSMSGFWQYTLLNPSTYFQHKLRSGRHMLPAVIMILLFYLPLRGLYRSQNKFQKNTYNRVNPATFVD